MPITQDRLRTLLDAALELRRILDSITSIADRELRNPEPTPGSVLTLIAETSIPHNVLVILEQESERWRLTHKRNVANASSARRRREKGLPR